MEVAIAAPRYPRPAHTHLWGGSDRMDEQVKGVMMSAEEVKVQIKIF